MLSAIIYYWPLYVLVLSVCYINVVVVINQRGDYCWRERVSSFIMEVDATGLAPVALQSD